jgi:hypothetical protein
MILAANYLYDLNEEQLKSMHDSKECGNHLSDSFAGGK